MSAGDVNLACATRWIDGARAGSTGHPEENASDPAKSTDGRADPVLFDGSQPGGPEPMCPRAESGGQPHAPHRPATAARVGTAREHAMGGAPRARGGRTMDG
jgi:hypothetical protein